MQPNEHQQFKIQNQERNMKCKFLIILLRQVIQNLSIAHLKLFTLMEKMAFLKIEVTSSRSQSSFMGSKNQGKSKFTEQLDQQQLKHHLNIKIEQEDNQINHINNQDMLKIVNI
ncbi:unnamed protein product [Paramecium sonneborni]|uniref:Uncharacterized protein n=1 Tax=Paramecium sonneborni TaxID=65129 RepID=A0A8S1RJZ2_9CILI|nr:unnamed protein product [Paramecium sonneborni]